jgi:hypothetical protein
MNDCGQERWSTNKANLFRKFFQNSGVLQIGAISLDRFI